MTYRRPCRLVLVPVVFDALCLTGALGAAAAPEGTPTIAMHFTPVAIAGFYTSPYEALERRRP